MACSTQIRREDWAWRAWSQAWITSGAAFLAGFLGGTLTWAGWVAAQGPVAGVHFRFHVGELLQQVIDAVGLQCGLVVHPPRPERAVPQGAPALVADLGELDRVGLLLAGHERPPPGPARLRAADDDLAAVDPQPDAMGGGIGEHVSQGVQPRPGRGGISPAGQQRPDLVHGAGHRGAVHPYITASAACGTCSRSTARV